MIQAIQILGFIVLTLAALIWIFWEKLPIRLVWPYLRQAPIEIEGEVKTVKFVGKHAGEQTYFVYLPKGYNSSNQNYKTIYHLHGAYVRESWAKYECQNIGKHVENAVAAGLIEPMIVVCAVDPEGNSMWSDSFDGKVKAWTAFTKDLIPHVDANYRTIADRDNRVMQGFSMGGFGAVMNAFRSPDLFSTLVIWDGAIHDWNSLTTMRKGIADKMFDTEAYFNQWSPWALTANTTSEDANLDIFMVVGTMKATSGFGDRFRPHLDDAGHEYTYVKSQCPHSMFCLMDNQGEQYFKFLAEKFARIPA